MMHLRALILVLSCLAVWPLACGDDTAPPGRPPTATTVTEVTEAAPQASEAPARTPVAQPSPTQLPPSPAATQPPATATLSSSAELPIIDMHFHADTGWDIAELVALMDELGVEMAVGGSGDSGIEALRFAAAYPERFVPFAGQDGMRALNLIQGAPSWNLETAEAQRYVDDLEEQLAAGCWAGIGEIFVNTLGSHVSGGFSVPADSEMMRRVFELSGQYGVPLGVHMDAAPASVAELRRLLEANREGTWLWAHAGWYADAALLRDMLETYPNLYIELSFRDELRSFFPVTQDGELRDEWRALLEDLPDRFVLGTDLLPPPTPQKYRELAAFWRGVLEQLTPETAAMLAHGNAERLLSGWSPADAASCISMLG